MSPPHRLACTTHSFGPVSERSDKLPVALSIFEDYIRHPKAKELIAELLMRLARRDARLFSLLFRRFQSQLALMDIPLTKWSAYLGAPRPSLWVCSSTLTLC